MKSNTPADPSAEAPWSVTHPLNPKDSVVAAVLRSAVAPKKGKSEGTESRVQFNEIMERVAVPEGVTFKAATEGGIAGWWVRPARTRMGAAILHAHGGWFNWGTARAFRNFVCHIALSAEMAPKYENQLETENKQTSPAANSCAATRPN